MIVRRLASALVVLWALGFLWFAVTLPQPSGSVVTDAVIVPTGAAGRIEHGIEVVRSDRAKAMLVTGVDPEVKPGEFAAQFEVTEAEMDCCVTLGFAAVDTRGNASETARWVEDNRIRSLRLVTSDWHMRRAAGELSRTLSDGVRVIEDAVPSEPSLRILFLEYHKFLASGAARVVNG